MKLIPALMHMGKKSLHSIFLRRHHQGADALPGHLQVLLGRLRRHSVKSLTVTINVDGKGLGAVCVVLTYLHENSERRGVVLSLNELPQQWLVGH